MAHVKSAPELERPDIQVVATPFGLDFSEGLNPSKEPGMYLLGYQIRPNTHSSVHIKDADAGSAPTIHANYFGHEEDRRVTGAIVDRLRDVTAQEPLATRSPSRSSPGSRCRPRAGGQVRSLTGDHDLPRGGFGRDGAER